MECFAAALERALTDAALRADPGWVARALTASASALTEGFHRGLGPGTDRGAFVAPVRALVGQAAGAAAAPAAGAAGPAAAVAALLPALRALEDAVWQAWDHHAELIPVVQALESVPGLEPGDRARLGVRALAMQGARAEAWARACGATWLKVETQNVNVPACRFYARQGCVLGAVDRFAYPALPDEVRLLWCKHL